jgi:nuclear factor 6 (one cut domain family protein 1)
MCVQSQAPQLLPPKKPRMVFTEIQRRTLVAIFREIKRPSKEIQATIAEQLGLKVSTVVNFFMNARRRSVDKYLDETPSSSTSVSDRDLSAVSSTANHLDEATALMQ